jgi:DNA repair exonuclease SbcCD ATPase subunit
MDKLQAYLREAEREAQSSGSSKGADDLKSSLAGMEKVLRLALGPKDQLADPRPTGASSSTGGPKRDWGATLGLVHQAGELIRVTEQRLEEAEARGQQLVQRAMDELRAAETRIQMLETRLKTAESQARDAESRAKEIEGRIKDAEMRARDAEGRAKEAEEWLSRFHDAIVDDLATKRRKANDPYSPSAAAI